MTAPACPKLALALYQEVIDSTEELEDMGNTLFYLLGAILKGGYIDVTNADTHHISFIEDLPSYEAFRLYLEPDEYTQGELTAALVAIKLST